MSEFQPIGLQHKPLFDEALSRENSKSSSDSFGNVFLWDILCRRNVAVLGERLGIEYLCSKGAFYAYPSGRGDLVPAIDALRARAAEQGRPLYLEGVTAPLCRGGSGFLRTGTTRTISIPLNRSPRSPERSSMASAISATALRQRTTGAMKRSLPPDLTTAAVFSKAGTPKRTAAMQRKTRRSSGCFSTGTSSA